MTQLYFYYSPIYNKSLAALRDNSISDEEIEYGIAYVPRIINSWYQYNDRVFELFKENFGMVLPDIWNIYLISYQQQELNFSMPTTITVSEDFEHVITKIIHELSHLMIFMNGENKESAVSAKEWNILDDKFPKKSIEFKEHILVQFITFHIVSDLYGVSKAKTVMARELDYKQGEIGEAWKKLFDNGLDKSKPELKQFLKKL